jgi:hypothetical protein
MRSDSYRAVIDNPQTVFDHYEDFKRSYKQTDQSCRVQGLQFSPMVLEAQGGGWSAALRRQVEFVARNSAAAQAETTSVMSLIVAQRISCSLQRENARAILKRQAAECDDESGSWSVPDSCDAW